MTGCGPDRTVVRMLPRHFLPLVVGAAALAGAAATAPPAQAAGTCKLENGVLEVRLTTLGHVRFAVVAEAIVVLVDGNQSTCAGGPPKTTNTEAVLVVDDSDDASTPTPNDGFSSVTISDPQTFAPGITTEPTGKSEIEFLLDLREGTDQLVLSAPGVPASLVVGSDGANWNGDDDRDLTAMPYDILRLFGGAGDDRISAGGGAGTGAPLTQVTLAEMRGGAGDDMLRATDGPASESVYGEDGDDVVQGGEGPDVLVGGLGDDTVAGGGGVDWLDYFGSSAPVTVDLSRTDPQSTGQGRDTLAGGIENVSGSIFSDTLIGDGADNELRGHFGDDTLVGGGGSDVLSGEGGSDTASFAGERAAVAVDLPAGRAQQGAETAALASIENAVGSPFGDVLTGDAQANRLEGGPGADTVVAGAGADSVEVRDGERDDVTCGADADAVTADRQTLEAIGPDCESVDALPEPTPATGEPSVNPVPALSVALTGARSQRLLRQKAARVRVSCSLACAITARAGAAKRVRTALEPGVARKLELRLSRRQLATLRRALATGKRPSLRIAVEARDAAGTRVVRTLRVRAVRRSPNTTR
jgi:Ca2+-binding RTX toxin-like protein